MYRRKNQDSLKKMFFEGIFLISIRLILKIFAFLLYGCNLLTTTNDNIIISNEHPDPKFGIFMF